MTDPGNELIGRAATVIAAITGQTIQGATEMLAAAKASARAQSPADAADVDAAVQRLCTRIGLAPALEQRDRQQHIQVLRSLAAAPTAVSITCADVLAWDEVLRSTPEQVPTLDREPVLLADMPEHQEAMWATLMDFEQSGPPPWVLIGGQMTALHLTEHAAAVHRPTDDGDVVVGVWTRREALRSAAVYLTDNDFKEVATGDGYGYRFVRGKTAIDVMIPEGLSRQKRYPTTTTGRPGLSTEGGNQALTRAERLPVNLNGRMGHIRRPTLLGALVVKAHARVVDARNPERHAQDLIALAELALGDPRSVLSAARPDDRRAVRAALRHLPAGHRLLRTADDPAAVHALLSRLAQPPG